MSDNSHCDASLTDIDDSENRSTNPSSARAFADIVSARASRRDVLQGALAGGAVSFMAAPAVAKGFGGKKSAELVGFDPLTIEQATKDQTMPLVAEGYEYKTFIPWGTPITPGATRPYNGEIDRRPTSEEAALQLGTGHDGMGFFPVRRGFFASNRKGMLCLNHEYGTNPHVLGKPMPESLEDVRLSQHVHGVSVVAIEEKNGEWEVVDSPNARRITANSPMEFSGPAAGSPLLENPAGNKPQGTFNNCGAGMSPWGTYLTCEENVNGNFGWNDEDYQPTENQERYGFSAMGFYYGWHSFDPRFDVSNPDYANETHRFGWIVEIDPFNGKKTPVKRTALGRFKHEAITIFEATDGRIAAYMGDDQQFEYCYRFVSAKPWREAIKAGESPLDEGALYVARFDEDGKGEWLELSLNVPALAERFADMGELLVNTRIAADIVGATPMDRPEWTTLGKDGGVYWTLTNNVKRKDGNVANPQAPNPDGHIIRTKDDKALISNEFEWEIFMLASASHGTKGAFGSPDAAYADPDGRLFIGTDGGQPDSLVNQVLVFDATKDKPEPKRLVVGVKKAEMTGWAVTPDHATAFVNVQHPGNGDPSVTNFPLGFDGETVPRCSTLIIKRKDGGVVGS